MLFPECSADHAPFAYSFQGTIAHLFSFPVFSSNSGQSAPPPTLSHQIHRPRHLQNLERDRYWSSVSWVILCRASSLSLTVWFFNLGICFLEWLLPKFSEKSPRSGVVAHNNRVEIHIAAYTSHLCWREEWTNKSCYTHCWYQVQTSVTFFWHIQRFIFARDWGQSFWGQQGAADQLKETWD